MHSAGDLFPHPARWVGGQMKGAFNARAARAKRPCPLWVDAFLRDTTHLEADEIGAYLLLLMAMWIRESCDLPDDDARLARVSRVSTRLWKSRVGPAIRPMLSTGDGVVFSKRLREEATYVERQVQQQSDRKPRENPDKPLINKEPVPSADGPADEPRDHPSYNLQPTEEGSGGSAREADEPDLLEQVLVAARVDVTKDPTGKWFSSGQRWTAERWRDHLGLTDAEIVEEVESVMRGLSSPPSTLAYFDGAMARAAGRKQTAPLTPIAGGGPARASPDPDASARAAAERERRLKVMLAAVQDPEKEPHR